MKFASRGTAPFASTSPVLQLGCLATGPASVRAAIDSGADCVRVPYETAAMTLRNTRNERLAEAVRYAHRRARKLVLDLTMPADAAWGERLAALAWAEENGVDAVVLSDAALAAYSAVRHPALRVHALAPASVCARTARLMAVQLNAARILVPDTVSTAQLVEIVSKAGVDIEVMDVNHSPVEGDAACNDACISADRRRERALARLPLLASLGVRAVQVGTESDMPRDLAMLVRRWRLAIDRCLARPGVLP